MNTHKFLFFRELLRADRLLMEISDDQVMFVLDEAYKAYAEFPHLTAREWVLAHYSEWITDFVFVSPQMTENCKELLTKNKRQ